MFTILVMRPEFEAYANIVYGHLEMAGYNVRKDSNYELPLDTRILTQARNTICLIGYEEYTNRFVSIKGANETLTLSLNDFFAKYQ